jgi:transglutaminase-like putative cysteine protease
MTLATVRELIACSYFAGQLSVEAYWRRLRERRSPFAPTFNYPRRSLRRASLAGRTLSREPFLRPTRDADCHAPEIVALAEDFRAGGRDDRQYLEAVYDYVRNTIDSCFDLPARHGCVGVIQRGFGICNEKLNVFVALSRAGGIPARYCSLGVAPGQTGLQALMSDETGIFGAILSGYRRFLADETGDPRARRVAALLLKRFSQIRRRAREIARANPDHGGIMQLGHYIAEVRLGDEWIPVDPILSDADCVPATQRFGEEPIFLRKAIGMSITGRMEVLPRGPRVQSWLFYGLGRGFMDHINHSRNRRRLHGREQLERRAHALAAR